MHGADAQSGALHQPGELLGGETPGHRVALAPAAVRVLKGLLGLLEVTGEGPGQHGTAQSGGEQAEDALGAQGGHRVADAFGGVVDVLQHAVAQHDVVPAALDHVEEAVGVALDAPHPVGDTGFGGAPLQGEERVRAGVDDRDAVAEPGGGHGEVAAAASGVEDVQRLTARGFDPAVQGVLQDLPDHGGTKRGAGSHRVRHGR